MTKSDPLSDRPLNTAGERRRFPLFDVALLFIGAGIALIGISFNFGGGSTLLGGTGTILVLLGALVGLVDLIDKFLIHRGLPSGKSRAMRYAAGALFITGLCTPMVLMFRATGAVRDRAAPARVAAATENGELQLTVPSNWSRSVVPGMDLAVEGPEGVVLIEDGPLQPETATNSELLPNLANAIYGEWPDFQVTPVRAGAAGSDQRSVVEVTGRNPETDVQLRIQLQLICRDDFFVLVRVAAPTESWSTGRPVLERVAESLTVSAARESLAAGTPPQQ